MAGERGRERWAAGEHGREQAWTARGGQRARATQGAGEHGGERWAGRGWPASTGASVGDEHGRKKATYSLLYINR